MLAQHGKVGRRAACRVVITRSGHLIANGIIARVQIAAAVCREEIRPRLIAASVCREVIAADGIGIQLRPSIIPADKHGDARGLFRRIAIRPAAHREAAAEDDGALFDFDRAGAVQKRGRARAAHRRDVVVARVVDVQVIGADVPQEGILGNSERGIRVVIGQRDDDFIVIDRAEVGVERARKPRFDLCEGDGRFAVLPCCAGIADGVFRLGDGKVDIVALRAVEVRRFVDHDFDAVAARIVGHAVFEIFRLHLRPNIGCSFFFVDDGHGIGEGIADIDLVIFAVCHLIGGDDIFRRFVCVGKVCLMAADIRPAA